MEEGGALLSREKVVVVACDMLTAYGRGVQACWDGLFSNKTAISKLMRFDSNAFQTDSAATIEGLKYHGDDSLVMQMLEILFDEGGIAIPDDARLILATTKGEVDFLEKELLRGGTDFSLCSPDRLLNKVSKLIGVRDTGMLISAACISSAAAVARAASMIRSGRADCVIVVACDSVTELVFSGFSSLMALDKFYARPFDKNRSGLSLGEAAALALVMSESRAKRENREIVGEVAGWGLSNDANHMTGPSRDGSGLVRAIKKALRLADVDEEAIASICAHGTGTVYNDSMEMNAFHSVSKDSKKPVYSIKGAIGHTLGSAGLIEMIIALQSLKDGIVPPTINLENVDEAAKGWVFPDERSIDKNKMALSTNSGFGGVNAALVLT